MSAFLNNNPAFLEDVGTSPLGESPVVDNLFGQLPEDIARYISDLDYKRQRVLITHLLDCPSLFEEQNFSEIRNQIEEVLRLLDFVDVEGDRIGKGLWKKLLDTDLSNDYPVVIHAGLYHRLVNPIVSFDEAEAFMNAFDGKIDFTPLVTSVAIGFIEEGDLLSAYDLIDYFKSKLNIEAVRGALKKQLSVLQASHKEGASIIKEALDQLG